MKLPFQDANVSVTIQFHIIIVFLYSDALYWPWIQFLQYFYSNFR